MRHHHLWLAALLPACGAVASGPGFTIDGGPVDDAGAQDDRVVVAPFDRGFAADNGFVFPVDAGLPTDNGFVFPVDQGFPVDRGFAVDRPDAGTRVDAGPARLLVVAGRRCTGDETCVSPTADLVCTPLSGAASARWPPPARRAPRRRRRSSAAAAIRPACTSATPSPTSA